MKRLPRDARQQPPKKRLFIGFLLASLITILGAGVYSWFLIKYHSYTINKVVISSLGVVLTLVLLLAFFGIGGMILTIWREQTFPFLQRWMIMAVNLLFPVALGLARLLGIKQDRLKSSFIEVSNTLVKAKAVEVKPQGLLILTPHCLQNRDCRIKITVSAENCERCGRCTVDKLLNLTEKYGVGLAIVTGGTLARKVIMERRPQAVVAVACERDLTSGIQDMAGIPVLGVLNERPEGPCSNTLVSLDKVEDAIQTFLRGNKFGTPENAPGSGSTAGGKDSAPWPENILEA